MIIIAILLIIVGLTKLYLATISDKMEMKEITHGIPIIINIPPEAILAIITADGLLNLFGGIALLLIW